MQLVAVSVIKNADDIIEAFVRHTRAWVDHHLVFDHDSTDATREILGALVREGFPLSVFTDEALGNLQQARSNQLTRQAAADLGADWVIPLDPDEFLSGPSRAALEKNLAALAPGIPASLRLLNYYPTAADDAAQINPVLRLRHCERQPGPTKKVMVPRVLALDPSVAAGMGSHALQRGNDVIPDAPLPDDFHLSHFPERSPGQQAMRLVLAELQKLSRGRSQAGVGLHYRLGFQMLAENPGMFLESSLRPVDQLRAAPCTYLGGRLRYTPAAPEWSRLAHTLLPYLEKLARSHGELLDGEGSPAASAESPSPMRRLGLDELTARTFAGREDAFAGFTPLQGWELREGPIANACLPAFHWGVAPATELVVKSSSEKMARLTIEALTYSGDQKIMVESNGATCHEHAFERVRQRERITCLLPLKAGENRLALRYSEFLQTKYDPRKLAVIYLSLRVT